MKDNENNKIQKYLYDMMASTEATNRILKVHNDYPLENARRIISLRNLVAHEYDVIDDAEIWAIVKRYLPELLVEVRQHLAADEVPASEK